MSRSRFGEWRPIASAPKDGTKILVQIRESEQGAAEVDMVRWAKPDRAAEEFWVSTDSDPGCPVIYAEAELSSWMPLPTPLPKLRSARLASSGVEAAREAGPEEIGGSGI